MSEDYGASGPAGFEHGLVLGTRIDVTSYAEVQERVIALARSGKVGAVAAANTHLIGEALADPAYAEVLRGFEMVVPDGMPLVWVLRLDGHVIRDRVYGPYLMQYILQHSPLNLRHYFFGGTEECLCRLQERALLLNPKLQIVGAVSPPFGVWDSVTESKLIDDINAAKADFIWVALGGVKQEKWIAQNRHRFQRGVFLAVGDAFALVAGLRSMAPAWMQRLGLTWVYRLASEPRRLFARYLRYNTRFVAAFLKERLCRMVEAGK
jgi:N-acetylglucosaminyldiphosphoundecaprenol N-acetyl-beta-D-mannosaminyltransferase